MKIAYFLDVPKGFGGAGNLLLQQAVLMSELYDVIVVIPADETGSYNYEYAKRCEQHHIPYTWIEYSTAWNFMSIDYIEYMKSVVSIEEFAKKENITFFHSVQLNIAVEYVSRKLKIPHLMDIYQLREDDFRLCPGDIYSHYHLCDSILYSNLWNKQLGVDSRCIRPIAILDNIRKKAVYSKDNIKLLMLGVVCPRKNQMTAIKAVAQSAALIAPIKLELHIAGDIDNYYAEECIEYVKVNKLDQFIVFHDFVSDITPLLESCDCLLCASTDESFPSSIVEALTYDLTIISTPVAGVPEVFFDKNNSFISVDFTVEGIKDSILECLEYYKNGKIIDIHKNAEKTWLSNFERKTVRKQIDLYYKYISANGYFRDNKEFLNIEKDVKQTELLLHDINDDGEKWIYTKYLYYTLVRKKLKKGKIYIWGAGKLGKLTFEILKKICPDTEIIAFIDRYKEGSYCEIPVIKLEDVQFDQSSFYCISFASGRYEAIQYLEDKGLALNTQIWCMP